MNINLSYLAQILFLYYDVAKAIDCYVCTSIGQGNPLCKDEFQKTISTSIFISRNCDFDYFKATHCIKLKGIREDGTEILVRQCGDGDWGSHCGDIMYYNGDKGAERVNGCLETCNHDGCNKASKQSYYTAGLVVFFSIMCIIVWL